MRILGDKLITRRNRNESLTFVLNYENGDPFVLSSKVDNPYFIMTIASSSYSQKDRYIRTWWLPLSDWLSFENTEILSVDADEFGMPILEPEEYVGTYVVNTIHLGKKHYWYAAMTDSEGAVWLTYSFKPVIMVFTVQDTSEWIEQNYRWDASIVVGTLTGTEEGPQLKDFVVVKSIIQAAKMEVSSDSMGGLY